jgi:hypothetical protein
VTTHFLFQLGDVPLRLGQWSFVAFNQFVDALRELLTHAVHLAVNNGVERRKPFVVNHQRFDLCLGELGVSGAGFGVQRGIKLLRAPLTEPAGK